MKQIHGIFAVTVTHFQENGEIDYAACAKHINWLIESGVQIDQLEDEADWRSAAISQVWPEMETFVGGRAAINAFLSAIGKKPWK